MKPYFFLTLLLNLLCAQEQDPSRFKKPPQKSEQLETAIRSLEYLEVSKKALQSWYQQNPGKPLERALKRAQTQKWLDRGEAHLIDYSLQTGVVIPKKKIENSQSVAKEVIYPRSYFPPRHENQWPLADQMESKFVGNSWSVSFHPSQEGKASDELKSNLGEHHGNRFHSPLVEKTHQDGDTWTPIFQSYSRPSWHSLPPSTGGGILASQFDSWNDPEKAILLLSEGHKSHLAPIKKNSNFADNGLTISANFIQVPSSEWTSFTKSRTLKDLELETAAWANKLILKKKGSVLHSPSMMLRLGQRGTVNNSKDHIYPTSYYLSRLLERISSENPLLPTNFDTRRVGFSLELEPNQDSSGTLTAKYYHASVSLHGKAPHHRFFDGNEWVADAWMPRFSRVTQSGTVALSPGENTLVGVSAVIDDQGNPDPNNRLLFFLKAE